MSGNFNTLIIELNSDCLHNLGQQDQDIVENIHTQDVDTIRLIKTNKNFYNQMVQLFLKYRAVNFHKLAKIESQ